MHKRFVMGSALVCLAGCGGSAFVPLDGVMNDAGADDGARCTGVSCLMSGDSSFDAVTPADGDGGSGHADAARPIDASPVDDATPPPLEACVVLTHEDGLGQSFLDCTPLGDYSEQLADEACHAYAGAASSCHATSCPDGDGGTSLSVVWVNGQVCASWGYGGVGQGHVFYNGSSCQLCPTSTDGTWQ